MKRKEVINKIINNINKRLEDCPQYVLEFGVFAGTEKDKRAKERIKGKIRTKVDTETGLTNAEIMFIMENGSPLRNVPARPVLDITRKYALESLVPDVEEQIINIWLTNDKQTALAKIQDVVDALALRIEAYVKTGIRRKQFDLAPNALSTIEAKGSDIPLLNTGQLANSITCVARRIK